MEEQIKQIIDDVNLRYMTYQINREQAVEEIRTRIARASAEYIASVMKPVLDALGDPTIGEALTRNLQTLDA